MKKFFILFWTILATMSANAQIQRKFFDFELGKSTEVEVVSYFQKKGFNTQTVEDILCVGNVRFAGFQWHTAFFKFYKGKLCSISFTNTEQTIPLPQLEEMCDRLKKNLNRKYPDYFNSTISNDEFNVFTDNATDLTLRYSRYELGYNLLIMYSDLDAMRDQIKEEINEL